MCCVTGCSTADVPRVFACGGPWALVYVIQFRFSCKYILKKNKKMDHHTSTAVLRARTTTSPSTVFNSSNTTDHYVLCTVRSVQQAMAKAGSWTGYTPAPMSAQRTNPRIICRGNAPFFSSFCQPVLLCAVSRGAGGVVGVACYGYTVELFYHNLSACTM